MTTEQELNRMYERLDDTHVLLTEMRAELAAIRADVKVNAVLCADCRPKVMGGGEDSLDRRVTRLEEARVVSKTFFLALVSVAGATGSLATAFLRLMGVP